MIPVIAMSTQQQARDIALRFGLEVAEIQRLVNFLQAKTSIDVYEIDAHNGVLQKNGLGQLPTRHVLGLPPHLLGHDELAPLVPQLDRQMAAIDQTVSTLNSQIDSLDLGTYMDAVEEHPGFMYECVEYLRAHLSDHPTSKEGHEVVDRAVMSGELVPAGDEDISEECKTDRLRAAVPGAIYRSITDRLSTLMELRERFDEIKVIAESSKPGASTSAYRQAFIAMMAAFDAALFDLVSLAVCARFDELAPGMATSATIEKDLAKFGNTEVGRAAIVDKNLRTLGDLLSRLHQNWNVRCGPDGGEPAFARIKEILARRNLQLHNRGIVDERYLEVEAATGKPKFNLYALKRGDSAIINDHYWGMAKEVCTAYIREVTIWASTEQK